MDREKMYESIELYGISSKEALKSSQEYDKIVFEEMIKDPKIEVLHLRRIIQSKNEEIRGLQRRILELSDIAACAVQTGETVKNAIASVMMIAVKEGLVDEI